MVSAWWLLLAFFVGGYVGMLLMALMAVARDNHADSTHDPRAPRRADGPVPRDSRSNDDWMI